MGWVGGWAGCLVGWLVKLVCNCIRVFVLHILYFVQREEE
jgi:hypothetical protein